MINTTHFSPLGRVFTFFLEKAADTGFSSVRLVVDSVDYDQELSVEGGSNREVFDTVVQRIQLLACKEFSGTVHFISDEGNVTRQFKVVNCLVTDQPVEDEEDEFTYRGSTVYGDYTKIVNGFHNDKDILYKESLDVDYSIEFNPENLGLTDDVRPLYAYKFLGLKDGIYYILGPRHSEKVPIIAKQIYDDKVFNICCDNETAKELGVIFSKEAGESSDNVVFEERAVKVILRADGNQELFTLKSKPYTVFNHPISFDEIMKVIKFAVFCEDMFKHETCNGVPGLDIDSHTLYVDLRNIGGRWYMANTQDEFFKEFVEPNLVCKILDENFASNSSCLYLKDKNKAIPISWDNPTKSSAALSVAFLLAVYGYGSWTEIMFNIVNLYKKGYLVLSDEGDLKLGPSLFSETNLTLNCNIATQRLDNFKLVESKKHNIDGYALFGYDRDEDIVAGKPENYCVALVRGDKITNVYDPYPVGNWKKYGDDLTPFDSLQDSHLYDIVCSAHLLANADGEGVYHV